LRTKKERKEKGVFKMTKVRISGYSSNERSRIFEILDREEIEEIIKDLFTPEIYQKTMDKALGYYFSGTAYTYIDARDGEIYTDWIQQNNELHPFDDFYRIILCGITTPVDEPSEDDLLDSSELDDYLKWEEENYGSAKDYITETMGEKELEERYDTWIEWLAQEFELDLDSIERQLDDLYFATIEEDKE